MPHTFLLIQIPSEQPRQYPRSDKQQEAESSFIFPLHTALRPPQTHTPHDAAEPPHVLDDDDGGRHLPGAEPPVRPVGLARRHLVPDEAPGRQGLAGQHGGHGGAGHCVFALHLCVSSLLVVESPL